jgi:anti-sigma regulatory factor (Ser/Thr protein kinase)
MQAALGQTVPLERREVAGAAGATYRLRVAPWRFPFALRALRRLRRLTSADHDCLRLSLGIGTRGALYLLVIAASAVALDRLRSTPEHARFLQRWGDRTWCSTWEPESEFGNWESYKLRDGQLTTEPLVVDARLPAQPIAAREARALLRARLATVDPASLDVLQVLTTELVANNVKHAGLTPEDWTGLQVRANHEWSRVEVIDHGRRFEPRIPLAKSADEESGWGLFIVNQKADRWGIIDRGDDRRVWFELRIPVRDKEAPGTADV